MTKKTNLTSTTHTVTGSITTIGSIVVVEGYVTLNDVSGSQTIILNIPGIPNQIAIPVRCNETGDLSVIFGDGQHLSTYKATGSSLLANKKYGFSFVYSV